MPRKVSPISVQCRLAGSSNGNKTVFLPKDIAQKGMLIEINKNGTWQSGWLVLETGLELPFDTVLSRGFEYILRKNVRVSE